MSLQAAFIRAASEKRRGIRFVHDAQKESWRPYAELYEKALRVLGALHEKGLGAGDELVIQVEDNESLLLLFWACILGGIYPVPLSYGVQSRQRSKLYKIWKYLSNPFLVTALTTSADAPPAGGEGDADPGDIMERTFDSVALMSYPRDGRIVPVTDEDIAYIQFSSGSTGEPKGVCLTHGNLEANIKDIIQSLEISDSDILLSWMPLTHDMGMIGFHLMGIVKNVDIVCMDTSLFVRRPLSWMERTHASRASVLYSPNFGLQYFLSSFSGKDPALWDLSCVRIIVNGAETISEALCKRFTRALHEYGLNQHAIVTAYGLAEASVEVSAMPVNTSIKSHWLNRDFLNIGDVVRPEPPDPETSVNFVDVGLPVVSCSVRICDNDHLPLPENTIGHIQIKGKNVTSGYYNNPIATRSVFTEDKWLITGDIGFMTGGRLVMTGRQKNIVIVNGKNYYPQDIEGAIVNAGLFELGKVAACGIRTAGTSGREELVIFVLHKGSSSDLLQKIDKIAAAVWNDVGVCVDKVVPVKKMPKTTSGKIQYFHLSESYLNGETEALPVMKQSVEVPVGATDFSPTSDALLPIMRSLLGDEGITENTDLIAAGMNSLTAIRFAWRIRELSGMDLPLEDLFQTNSIKALIGRIKTVRDKPLPSIGRPEKPACVSDLSPAQQRIWFETQLAKSSVAYHIPIVHRIAGPFDATLLERSLRALIRKYQILRTSYETDNGRPVQRVHAYEDALFSLSRTDMDGIGIDETRVMHILDREISLPFKLDEPVQIRGKVIRINENLHFLVLVFHHIQVDGWSLGILMKELSHCYNSMRSGAVLPEVDGPVVQYTDYVHWQKEIGASDRLITGKDYWLKEMEKTVEPVSLSGKRPVSNVYSVCTISSHQKIFSDRELSMIRELAAGLETTPFCILMALLNILLYRYTGEGDIVLGFDSSARVTKEMEGLVGYLINTLCLRIKINEEDDFDALVSRVNEKLFNALLHQLYPFEKLLESSRADKALFRNPFFDILVLYQNFYQEAFALCLDDCSIGVESVPLREGLAGLVLEFTEREDRLQLIIQYDDQYYGNAEIEQFTTHLANLLLEISAGGRVKKIRSVDFLTPEEKAMPYPALVASPGQGLPIMPVQKIFEQQALRSPDAIALVAGNTEISYGELNRRANRLAWYMIKKHGVGRNDKVGFLTGRDEHMVIAILAILKSGAAYVPLDPEFPVIRCEELVIDSEMKCLLTDDLCYRKMYAALLPELMVNMDKAADPEGVENPDPGISMDDAAYIIYTSGSTGRPKGVIIQHSSLFQYVGQFIAYFQISREDVFLQQASVAFDTLVEELFPALLSRGKIVIAKNGGRDVDDLILQIAANGVTVLSTTPLVLREINERTDDRIASLRTIISGGDILSPKYVDSLIEVADIYNTYGPSETTVCATYKRVETPAEACLIGRPVAGRQVYVLDSNMQMMPWGKPGHIHIAGGCALGYLNNAELTAERFVPNPFGSLPVLYRTGDLGRWTARGDLEFLGRNDNQVKVRGHRVEFEEVEKAINGFDGVSISVVWLENEDDFLIAFLLKQDAIREAELHRYVSEKLPYYMRPYKYFMVDEMPVTHSGKIDRKSLAASIGSRVKAQDREKAVPPASRMESLLLEIWREVLRKADFGVTDNFFELGGHSLKAIQLLNRVFGATGIGIELADVFIYPTIRLQSGLITEIEQHKYQFIDIV